MFLFSNHLFKKFQAFITEYPPPILCIVSRENAFAKWSSGEKRPFFLSKIQLKYSTLLNCMTPSLCFFLFSSPSRNFFLSSRNNYFLPPPPIEVKAARATSFHWNCTWSATKDIISFDRLILQKSVVEETYSLYSIEDWLQRFSSTIDLFRVELAEINFAIVNSRFVWIGEYIPMEAVDGQASRPSWPQSEANICRTLEVKKFRQFE